MDKFNMINEKVKLLSDAQIQQFIMDGFIAVSLDELGDEFHDQFYRTALERRPRGILTDDTDKVMPQIHMVLNCPIVRGALQSLLGPGYIRHPHSGVSVESVAPIALQSTPTDQGWHRDSYWGLQRTRHHRPRWLLCMYYPATVSLAMGPTAIAPGSQYYALPGDGDGMARPPSNPIRHDEIDDPQRIMIGDDLRARDQLLQETIESLEPSLQEMPMIVKAGTFCLFHYDLYHRRVRRATCAGPGTQQRVMFKLLFTSGRARTKPSWFCNESDPKWTQDEISAIPRELSESIWKFMLSGTNAAPDVPTRPLSISEQSVTGLIDVLHRSRRENERMRVAYQLARAARDGSDESIRQLVNTLQKGSDAVQRAAMHGLASAGPRAVEPLLAVLSSPDTDHHVLCCAVHAIGEAVEVPSVGVVEVIVKLMGRIKQTIDREVQAVGGWPTGGGGHPPSSGFGFRSPNPKERQAWTSKLLHASCIQALGVIGQQAVATGDDQVVHTIVAECVACLMAPEPGGGNPDYAPDSALGSGVMSRQNAALGLRMLCADSGAIRPEQRQMVEEACASSVNDSDPFLAHYCRDMLSCIR